MSSEVAMPELSQVARTGFDMSCILCLYLGNVYGPCATHGGRGHNFGRWEIPQAAREEP